MSIDTSAATWLTSRELDVLGLMTEGLSNFGISSTLFISERTVESHVARIMSKLDIPPSPLEHRRVLTVLHALRAAG